MRCAGRAGVEAAVGVVVKPHAGAHRDSSMGTAQVAGPAQARQKEGAASAGSLELGAQAAHVPAAVRWPIAVLTHKKDGVAKASGLELAAAAKPRARLRGGLGGGLCWCTLGRGMPRLRRGGMR